MTKTWTINSFRGGNADWENKGIAGSFKPSSGLDIRKTRDTLSCSQKVTLCTTSDNSGVFDGLVMFFVNGDDGVTYAFADNGKIYAWSGTTWVLKYTDPDGAIKGAEQWYDNTPQAIIVWATDTKIKQKIIPGNATWSTGNDVSNIATNLTSATWHTMAIANGNLQVCNSAYLGMYTFAKAWSQQIFTTTPDNILKTVIERLGNVVMGAVKKTNAEKGTLIEWIVGANGYTKKKEIPAKGVNAIVDGEVTIMQAGTNGGLIYSDFVNILPITSFPGESGQSDPGGADNYRGVAMFGAYGVTAIDGDIAANLVMNGIYTIGRKKKNAQFVLNLDYPIDADRISAVKACNGIIFVAYKKGSTNRIAMIDSTLKGNAIYRTLDFTPPVMMPDNGAVWSLVQLEMLPLPASCAVELWYRIDKSGLYLQAKLEGGSTQVVPNTDGSDMTRAVFQVAAQGRICELMVKLFSHNNATPEITKVITYFEV